MWVHNRRHRAWYLSGRGCTAIVHDGTGVRPLGAWTVSNPLGVFIREGQAASVEDGKAEAGAAHAELTELTTVVREEDSE